MKKHTKLMKIIVLLLFVCVSFTMAVTAEDDGKTVIKVGYDLGYGVLDDIDSLDNKGFGYDILTRAEHYSDYEFEYVDYDYYDAFDALSDGEIDIMGIMFESESYEENFAYVPKILGSAQLILATKEGDAYYDDPSEIDGKTVASFDNNLYEQYLDEYCEEHGIEIEYVRAHTYDYLELEADFYLVTTIDRNVNDFSMVLNLQVFNMYFIANKDNEALAESIGDAIELAISADGTFLEELQIKYYGSKNLTRRYLTRDELSLLEGRSFSCGYIDHHQPIQYVNEDGEPDGISVEVMNMLARQYNFSIEYVPYNHDMPNRSHENFDFLISATGDFVHETTFYTPSLPFLELPMMLLGKNDIIEEIVSENHSSVIGMLGYITLDRNDVLERYPNNSIITYDTFDELMDGYDKGEVDGILATEDGIEYAQAVLGVEHYSIRSTGLYLPLRIFVSKELDQLTDYIGAFNIMFEHLDQNRIDEIMSLQSVQFLPEYSTAEFLQENLYIIISVVLVVMLVIGAIIYYLQHKRKMAILDVINHDDITPLMSLYHFRELATEELQAAKPNEFQIISLDIDSFHTINTVYSKEWGNKVLVAIAEALKKGYLGTSTLITRVIADQFVLFRRTSEGEDILRVLREHVIDAVRSVMGDKYDLSMSVGYCNITDNSHTVDEIIDFAVAARLKGKQKYTLTCYEYNDEIRRDHEMKTSIVYRMNDALKNGEFTVVYQPKIEFKTMRVGGAEALVRWFSVGEYGAIPPGIFIEIFESNGFIANLDLYVFEEVCRFISQRTEGFYLPLISINISTITLFDDRFPGAYLDILSKYGVQPHKIELEITESAMGLASELLSEKVNEIKDAGFYMSIDDFGSGQSSLGRLGAIEAHTVKLDKEFLDFNSTDNNGEIVVNNMIKMAKELNMRVVSEGIETNEQAKWLKGLDCDFAQGYFFEKPMSEESFIVLLRDGKEYEIN